MNLPNPIKIRRISPIQRSCSMAGVLFGSWLTVPEFVDAIYGAMSNGEIITDRIMLDIAEPIFDKYFANKSAHPDFPWQNCRRGLNQLRRAVEEQSKQPV